eukprot:870066-Rhodomonas_salina.2
MPVLTRAYDPTRTYKAFLPLRPSLVPPFPLLSYALATRCPASSLSSSASSPTSSTTTSSASHRGALQNQMRETAISVHFVPGMRFLVIDFAVYAPALRAPYEMPGTDTTISGT